MVVTALLAMRCYLVTACWSACHALVNAWQISSVLLFLVGNSRPHALLLHDKYASCLCRLTSTKSGTTSASREHNALARPCRCSPTTASCLDHSSSRPRAHTAAMTLTQCTSSSRSPRGNTQSAIARACAMSAFLMGCFMYLRRSHPHVTRFTHNYSPDSKFFPPGGPGNAGSEGVCLPVNTGLLAISVACPHLGPITLAVQLARCANCAQVLSITIW